MGVAKKIIEGGLKAVAKKAPRMSKAELEASGFYHPIGRGLKLSKPAQEYTADIVVDPDMPLVPKKIVSPEDLYGKVGIPLVGDRSDTGKLLRGIEGITFDEPLKLEGGHKFGRAHQYKDPKVSSVWASDPSVVTALNNQIRRAAESGKDVLGVSSMGSPEMVDYNTMIAKSALNMTDLEGIHPKAIEAFNDEIKNLAKKNKETGKVTTPFKNFLGIDHPEVTTQLLSKDAGELRKAFIRTMEKDQYRKLGFPELAPIRKAVINPEILDMPLGSTGLDIYKMSPEGNIVEAPKNPHSTYPVHMQGEYFGGLEEPIDYKNMFSTFYEPKRLFSVPDRHAYRAYSLSAPIQEFNQQWLDEVMPIYQQKIKDITGRKKGGEVHPDGSARLSNGASARKTVEYLLKDQKFGVGGKALKKGLKALEDVAEKVKLPPAENAAKTQIVGTLPTYKKAKEILSAEGITGSDIIDVGSGRGLGSSMMRSHSMEPYATGYEPTYTNIADVPTEGYKGLTNFSVLNVVPRETRDEIVHNLGRIMKPEGLGLVTARDPSFMKTLVNPELGPEVNSAITRQGTYQKGFTEEELRDYIKYILGTDFEYEPLKELSGSGVKIRKKAEGGTISDDAEEYGEQLKERRKTLGSDILKSGAKGITEGVGNILRSAKETLSRAGTIGDIAELAVFDPIAQKARYESVTGKKFPELKPISLLPEHSITESPVGAKILPFTTAEQQFAGDVLGDPLSYSVSGAGRGLEKFGKFVGKGLAEQVQTGKGIIGRNIVNPRMNIIKDPGGMVVGGEKVLDTELLNMKKNEALNVDMTNANTLPEMFARREAAPKDPNAVALNQWIDTKVRKYIRNQAGTEADPILKAIESGVEHKFSPAIGDTKYYVRHKRELIGKPVEGIAKTDLGKEWEYKVDSTFTPKKSADIKEILNMPMEHLDSPAVRDRRRASMLRVEQDLPIHDEKDLEALKLINQIPDENVYTIDVSSLTNRLGLNHVSDVLYEDLQTGRLRPEQLNQMSIEKAIRRTAEYDAEKAKAMTKAHATSIEGMPIPKEYNDGYKWVELKHETDPKKTAAALKSEGEMMGHCVGGYCPNVESGEIKIFSLRGPDGKSHVTIEARPQFSMTLWRNANMDAINSNPKLKEYDFNMRSLDNDDKYGRQMTEQDYVRIMTKEMKKLGINPVEPPSYMELHQVKGKQNKRPDDKYQSYISDFIKNNPTKHEIVDVFELDNTNLMGVQNVADNGIVSKDIHNHPEVEKILKMLHPDVFRADAPNIPKSFSRSEELKYELFQETARDLARQGKNYLDKDDILNHLREKYLLPKKKSGGSINLNQEYKLENLRRRYG